MPILPASDPMAADIRLEPTLPGSWGDPSHGSCTLNPDLLLARHWGWFANLPVRCSLPVQSFCRSKTRVFAKRRRGREMGEMRQQICKDCGCQVEQELPLPCFSNAWMKRLERNWGSPILHLFCLYSGTCCRLGAGEMGGKDQEGLRSLDPSSPDLHLHRWASSLYQPRAPVPH